MAVAIKLVAAHKRWVLSGTPALANFSDVDQITSFLGIRIERYFLGDGTITTSSETKCKDNQTRVESFLSQTEVMCTEWHAARHDEARQPSSHLPQHSDLMPSSANRTLHGYRTSCGGRAFLSHCLNICFIVHLRSCIRRSLHS
jgi:hypothetical protein